MITSGLTPFSRDKVINVRLAVWVVSNSCFGSVVSILVLPRYLEILTYDFF